jgi:SNF family Na+-dependent transporter
MTPYIVTDYTVLNIKNVTLQKDTKLSTYTYKKVTNIIGQVFIRILALRKSLGSGVELVNKILIPLMSRHIIL